MSFLSNKFASLEPGEKFSSQYEIEGLSSIPYTLIKGKCSGNTVLITAGVHSAEYVGIQAAIELSQEISAENVCGNIVIVPLANVSGFEHRTMSMVYEDGKNLNRVFPGNSEGSAAERIAYTLFNDFILGSDYYIDLHCGDGYEQLTPYVYYVGGCRKEHYAKELASCVNVPYIVRSNTLSGGAYNAASSASVASILIERGGLGLFSREEIDADKEDVRNILKFMRIIDGDANRYSQIEFSNVIYEDAPIGGCWYPAKKAGDKVHKGEVLGEIRDYFGSTVHTCYALSDGIILYQTYSLTVLRNGPMIAYGIL